MTSLKVVNELDQNKWDAFVKTHPNGNIFQTSQMMKVYQNTKNYEPIFLAVLDETDEVQALVLAHQIKEMSGPFASLSARSIIQGGPIYKDSEDGLKALTELMEAYDNIAQKNAIFTQIRNMWDASEIKPILHSQAYIYEEHLNYLLDLTKTPDELKKDFSQSKRRGMRKAEKAGLIFIEEDNKSFIPVFYNILSETYKLAKMPYADISIFENAFEILLPEQMVKFFSVRNGDECIAGIAALMYKGIIYEWYIGSLKAREILKLFPNEFLLWNLLKWGSENNYQTFDFLGAGKPDKEYGVRGFKTGFGGELVEFGRFEKMHQPIKNKISKVGFNIWKKLR